MKVIFSNIDRYEIVKNLKGINNIGVELGVAEGGFSYKMMETKKFKYFFGIDSYDIFQHNENEYIQTKKKLSIFENYKLVRKKFENALNDFEDLSLDFIYVDGFAHEGNDGGRTLVSWLKKLKVGGICAGDDYDDNWPLVKMTVNDVVKQSECDLFITKKKSLDKYSQFPSWFFVKSSDNKIFLSEKYKLLAKSKHKQEIFKRSLFGKILNIKIKYITYTLLKKIFPSNVFHKILSLYKKMHK
jgi:hypothetical protein|tara:strand:- start:435 stop:1163 length:729 start_codon:yes stop_codon:yes gene_type:complete